MERPVLMSDQALTRTKRGAARRAGETVHLISLLLDRLDRLARLLGTQPGAAGAGPADYAGGSLAVPVKLKSAE